MPGVGLPGGHVRAPAGADARRRSAAAAAARSGDGVAGRAANARDAERRRASKELAALPHVKDVYPNLRVPVEVKYDGLTRSSRRAAGVPMSARRRGRVSDDHVRARSSRTTPTTPACSASTWRSGSTRRPGVAGRPGADADATPHGVGRARAAVTVRAARSGPARRDDVPRSSASSSARPAPVAGAARGLGADDSARQGAGDRRRQRDHARRRCCATRPRRRGRISR